MSLARTIRRRRAALQSALLLNVLLALHASPAGAQTEPAKGQPPRKVAQSGAKAPPEKTDAKPEAPAGDAPPPAGDAVPPAGAAAPPGAGSSEPAFDPNDVEVVKVTVDRREKDLQHYAGAATVFSQQDLARIGIHSMRELSSASPAVEIGTQEGNTEVFIRGVGSNYDTELGDPAVAILLDNVYLPRPRGLGTMLFDIQRVEVNRGPQGTLRGRNATAGSVNILTNQPKLGVWEASGSMQLGNYSDRVLQGVLNIPIGDKLAVRIAGFGETHDPYYTNAGPVQTIKAAESADSLAYRISAKWQPSRSVNVVLRNDYTKEGGTGYGGTNVAPALAAGILPQEIPDPRAVIYRGPGPQLDFWHWGVGGEVNLDFGPVQVQYVGSYRSMKYQQITGGNAGVAFPGMPAPQIDNWSTSYWQTFSQSSVHELRVFAPDTARFRWTLGGFVFDETQQTFLGSTADQSTGFAGIEYTMPHVQDRSTAAYADATFDILKKLRVTAGVRGTQEWKFRTGVGYVYSFSGTGNTPFRFGTDGFQWAMQGRTDFTPGGGAPFSDFLNGVSSFGNRDTLQNALNQPGVKDTSSYNAQFGYYRNAFVDFRVGLDYDITPNNLVYAMFSSGHHSGGFNDNITLPDGSSIAKTFKPETLYATEIGSKNELLDKKLLVNLAAFWYAYQDQQFQTIVAVGTGTPGNPAPSSAVRFNAASSRVLGLEADVKGRLPAGFVPNVSAVLLDARFLQGQVADTRVGFSAADEPLVNLSGKFLPRAPVLSLNYALAETIPTSVGYFDWLVSAQTRSKQYMTVFNGEGVDSKGVVNPNLSDVVPSYTRLDLGVGYTRPDGKTRFEGFINNVFNTTYVTTIIIQPGLNDRFYNPPRIVGVRLTMSI